MTEGSGEKVVCPSCNFPSVRHDPSAELDCPQCQEDVLLPVKQAKAVVEDRKRRIPDDVVPEAGSMTVLFREGPAEPVQMAKGTTESFELTNSVEAGERIYSEALFLRLEMAVSERKEVFDP